MNKTCLIVYGKKQDDARLSPGTAVPGEHWAYQLLGSFSEFNPKQHTTKYPQGVEIHWGGEGDDGISVRITAELWKNDNACFEHLMNFIRQHDLTYEFPDEMEECNTCERHPSCLANEHKVEVVEADASLCGNCPRAA